MKRVHEEWQDVIFAEEAVSTQSEDLTVGPFGVPGEVERLVQEVPENILVLR